MMQNHTYVDIFSLLLQKTLAGVCFKDLFEKQSGLYQHANPVARRKMLLLVVVTQQLYRQKKQKETNIRIGSESLLLSEETTCGLHIL